MSMAIVKRDECRTSVLDSKLVSYTFMLASYYKVAKWPFYGYIHRNNYYKCLVGPVGLEPTTKGFT